MSQIDKLLALGAYSCCGDLMWKNKVLATLRDGEMHLTDEGKAVLAADIEDVVIKSETKKPRAKKAEDGVAADDDVALDV